MDALGVVVRGGDFIPDGCQVFVSLQDQNLVWSIICGPRATSIIRQEQVIHREGDARNKSRMTSNGACFRLSLANPLDNLYPKNLLILSQPAAPELRQDHHLSIAGSRRSASLWHRRYCSSRRSSETASIRMSRPPWTAPGPASAIDYQTTCLPSCRP